MKDHRYRKLRFLMPLGILAFIALLTLLVQTLWNGVLVDVTGVKTVTYWQALGLLLLAKILFGGFPGRGCGGPGGWKHRMMAKRWESLNPEQREQMREEMRRRFGDWPRPPWCEPESPEHGSPAKPADPTGA